MRLGTFGSLTLVLAMLGAGCGAAPTPPPAPGTSAAPSSPSEELAPSPQPATAAGAEAFVKEVNEQLLELWRQSMRAAWVKSTYITHDTEKLSAQANERVMEYEARAIKAATRFDGVELPPEIKRQLYLLKYSAGLPAPSNAERRAELAELSTKMESAYGKGKFCSPKLKGKGKDPQSECLSLSELTKLMASSRNADLLLEVWRGWRTVSPDIRPMYSRFVELGNEGARELGFTDMGQIWKGRYDMEGDAFVAEMDRLWKEVKPLYDQLHCYVRSRLRRRYGAAAIGDKAPIPAHLLGNMWAQDWTNIYDLVEPFPGQGLPDLTLQLKRKKFDELKMVRLAEKFFVSLGMDPLPKTFWERSLFLRPRDRDVVCHASAWDVTLRGDLRIKMCIQVNHEDLVTIHHELGHNYYFHYYNHLPALYQAGANDGFHEGVGDTLALSVTPEYLANVGLYDRVPDNERAELNELMKRALEGIAFLPFGKMIDQWRWDVFSGKTSPADYNSAWWKLRTEMQGVVAPTPRSEKDFDPGAKFHIPANVPYTRYFIARILQYQFHRALCRAAGYSGPLHRCSIYESREAGKKMKDMLALGASKPWPDALETISGERQMTASAIIDYYAPLMKWLAQQNGKEQCGW